MGNKPKKTKVSAVANPVRKGHQLPARVSERLWKILQSIAQEERRSVAQVVVILLEEALGVRGKWPPSSAE